MVKTETMHLRSIHTNFAGVNHTVHPAGVLYGTGNGVWDVMRIRINNVRSLDPDEAKRASPVTRGQR